MPEERTINCDMLSVKSTLFHYKNEESPFTGKCQLFYKNGNKNEEISFVNGRYNGQNISFYKNGQKLREAHYRQGILDGSFSAWYFNGYKKIKTTYKKGEIAGDFIKWDYKGKIIFEKFYTLSGQKKMEKSIFILSWTF